MVSDSGKKNILLCVTGSIAAYKACELARLYVTWGFNVKVILSHSAENFVGVATFEAITNSAVATSFWDVDQKEGIEHITLADWADVVVIAPATADVIAKITFGFADSPLLASVLATKAPLLIAPAMNVNMFDNPATKENIEKLVSRGVHFVDPEVGSLACGWNGAGRLADPYEIFYESRRLLAESDLKGKRILITTGPTREPIDPVRFLSNRSSGKMGVELAREAYRRGAHVTLIHGPCEIKVPNGVNVIPVITAEDMYNAVIENSFESDLKPDVVIMSAAVADFKPKEIKEFKIKKHDDFSSIELTGNDDIITSVSEKRGGEKRPFLVGFAVETGEEPEELISKVEAKMKAKNLDMIVGNFAHEAFEKDTNRVWILSKLGKQQEVATTYKSRIADRILTQIVKQF